MSACSTSHCDHQGVLILSCIMGGTEGTSLICRVSKMRSPRNEAAAQLLAPLLLLAWPIQEHITHLLYTIIRVFPKRL